MELIALARARLGDLVGELLQFRVFEVGQRSLDQGGLDAVMGQQQPATIRSTSPIMRVPTRPGSSSPVPSTGRQHLPGPIDHGVQVPAV